MARWLAVLQPAHDVRPPPPASGIPRQRLPRGVRRALQIMVLPFVLLDVCVQRGVRVVLRPRFRLTGGCRRTGSCCRYITQPSSPGRNVIKRFADRLQRVWATEVNGFYERDFDASDDDGARVVVFSCRCLAATGRCKNYALRPSLCRTWPRVDFFVEPRLYKGCGYAARPRT